MSISFRWPLCQRYRGALMGVSWHCNWYLLCNHVYCTMIYCRINFWSWKLKLFDISKIRPKSLLGPVKAQKFSRCLATWQAPSHYLNQYWFAIKETLWHEHKLMKVVVNEILKTSMIKKCFNFQNKILQLLPYLTGASGSNYLRFQNNLGCFLAIIVSF